MAQHIGVLPPKVSLTFAIYISPLPHRRRRAHRGASWRIVAHGSVAVDRAQGGTGRLQPFARGPRRVTARRALTFEHPRRLLLRPGGFAAGVESGMGEGTGCGEDRRDDAKESIAGGGGAHRTDQPQPDCEPFKRPPVPSGDPDRRMNQLVREDRCDLRRHRVGGMGEVGPDEYLEMPIAAAPIVPALSDRLALGSPAGEADRHPHAGRKGGVQRLEQRRHAGRHPVQPAFAIVLLHFVLPSNRPRGDGLGHRPCLVANSGG